MRNIWLIIQREFTTRVRKKSFILITLLLPVFLGLLMIGMVYLATNSNEKLTIAVKDDSGLFQDKFRGLDEGETLRFKYLYNNSQPIDSLIKIYDGTYDALLYIPNILLDDVKGITYYSSSELGFKTETKIKKAITDEIRNKVLLQQNYNIELIEKLNEPIEIEKIINKETKSGNTIIAHTVGYCCGFLIYMFLIIYGAMVMKGITEEKSNRIVEVMLTSCKPFEMMLGKIIGIGAVGLTQFLFWMILTFVIQFFTGIFLQDKLLEMQQLQSNLGSNETTQSIETLMSLQNSITEINLPRIIFSFIFYFIFGYFFYAAQFAAIGAATNEDTDAQTLTFPITIPIIISMVLMTITLEQPSSNTAIIGSMLPFSSPIIMMSRIPFQINWWQQILSMLILVFSSMAMVYFASKIYKVGILIQGKKITLKEVFKWLFYKN